MSQEITYRVQYPFIQQQVLSKDTAPHVNEYSQFSVMNQEDHSCVTFQPFPQTQINEDCEMACDDDIDASMMPIQQSEQWGAS